MNLTYPLELWCPRCQVHLRSKDDYFGPTVLMDLCPICADDDRRAALTTDKEPAA